MESCNHCKSQPRTNSSNFCCVTCAICSDSVSDAAKFPIVDNRAPLLLRCISIEMIRLIYSGVADNHLLSALDLALQQSFSLTNAKAIIDEMYIINPLTDLTRHVALVWRAEISKHIIDFCPNFNATEALKHVVARTNPIETNLDANTLYRSTLYLLNAGADPKVLSIAHINSMLIAGYSNVLSYVEDRNTFLAAQPYFGRFNEINTSVSNKVTPDVSNIVMSYVGYDYPTSYSTRYMYIRYNA